MGNFAAHTFAMKEAINTVEESTKGLVSVVRIDYFVS